MRFFPAFARGNRDSDEPSLGRVNTNRRRQKDDDALMLGGRISAICFIYCFGWDFPCATDTTTITSGIACRMFFGYRYPIAAGCVIWLGYLESLLEIRYFVFW